MCHRSAIRRLWSCRPERWSYRLLLWSSHWSTGASLLLSVAGPVHRAPATPTWAGGVDEEQRAVVDFTHLDPRSQRRREQIDRQLRLRSRSKSSQASPTPRSSLTSKPPQHYPDSEHGRIWPTRPTTASGRGAGHSSLSNTAHVDERRRAVVERSTATYVGEQYP